MVGIVVVLGFSVFAGSQVRAARREGTRMWPPIAAVALMVSGVAVVIGGGLASETAKAEQDWLAAGLLLAVATVVTPAWDGVTGSRRRHGQGSGPEDAHSQSDASRHS